MKQRVTKLNEWQMEQRDNFSRMLSELGYPIHFLIGLSDSDAGKRYYSSTELSLYFGTLNVEIYPNKIHVSSRRKESNISWKAEYSSLEEATGQAIFPAINISKEMEQRIDQMYAKFKESGAEKVFCI